MTKSRASLMHIICFQPPVDINLVQCAKQWSNMAPGSTLWIWAATQFSYYAHYKKYGKHSDMRYIS